MAQQQKNVPPSLRQYWFYRGELTCLDGLLFKGNGPAVEKFPGERFQVGDDLTYYTGRIQTNFCLDGLPFEGNELIVPKTLQSETLGKIHHTHLGR